jgi:branched-chain amino acid transport system permease protein
VKRYALVALLVGLVVFPMFWADEFYLSVILNIFFSIILAVSLNLIIRTGMLSLAHAAFMGIGGYTSALTVMRLGFPFLLALVTAGVLAGAISLLFGRMLIRLRGVYFVLVTFSFGEVVRLFFVNVEHPFGSTTGILNIPPPRITFLPGVTVTFASKVSYYYLALAFVLLTVFVIQRIYRSSIGEALACTREAEHLAESTGIDTFRCKMFALGVGGFFAGLAGSLYAHYFHFISPTSFTFMEAVNLIVINIVGGMGWVGGPILGAIFLVPLPEFLRGFVVYQQVLYGLILILTISFLPTGLSGFLGRLRLFPFARTGVHADSAR